MSTQAIDREAVSSSPTARGEPPRVAAGVNFESFLLGAVAEAVFGAAFVCTAMVVLFGQSKPVEQVGYFLVVLLVVPASLALATRRSRRHDARERGTADAVIQLALTVAVICAARLVNSDRTSVLLLLELVVVRAATTIRPHPLRRPRSGDERRSLIEIVPLLLVMAAVPFVPTATLNGGNIAIAAASALASVAAVKVARGWPLPARRVLDIAAVSLCALVVFYLGHPVKELALNQNYFLGPTIDVLHGHPILVGTFSQYGFGMFDALSAFFSFAPIGYGSFTLLLSSLTALLFVAVYLVLRLSTSSQILAIAGLVVAVALNVFGQVDDFTSYPSTGALRFGLVWLVILLSVAAARSARRVRLLNGLVFVVLGLSAAWSGESGVYCLGTACAITCIDAIALPSSRRVRWRSAVCGVGRCLGASGCGVLLFTVLTHVATGAWPDWNAYADFIRLYTTGGLGALPIGQWSPGLALAAGYAASAAALLAVAGLRPALVRERLASFRAIAGLTAMGALVFTYFLDRAAPNNLFHIAPPAVALVFVWAGVADVTLTNRRTAAIATGATLFMGAFVVAAERHNIARKYPRTALAAVLGSSPGLTNQVRTLWHNPVVDPDAAHVARFVATLGVGRARLIVVLPPQVESEALLRLDQSNAVGTSNPCQESLSARGPARVLAGVRALRTGAILVTDTPSTDGGLLPIQQYTLAVIRSRFRLRQIGADGRGHRAFVLAARDREQAFGVIAAPAPTVPPLTMCA